MGCFSCFDSKEEEILNPHKENDDRKYNAFPAHVTMSRLSSGADRLKLRNEVGPRWEASAPKDLPDFTITAQTSFFHELAAATGNVRPKCFIGEGDLVMYTKGSFRTER
ncbi:hypothetical protein Ancab_018209 [Ancistrocladus abbreviatus]